MQRTSLLFKHCLKVSAFNSIKRLHPVPSINNYIKRQFVTTTNTIQNANKASVKTTTQKAGPPLNASRRVLPFPTKVTEMKLRCKYCQGIYLMTDD